MSVKKVIFQQLGEYLMATLQNVSSDFPYGVLPAELNLPGLKGFDKQMGQFINPELAYAVPLPFILMEYGDFTWETTGHNQQRGTGVIYFTTYFENYADSFTGSVNQELALSFFDFTEEVHKALQGFSLPDLGPLNRITDAEDTAEDMIITSKVGYSTVINDSSTDYARNFELLDDANVIVTRVKQISRPAGDTFKDGFVIVK